MRFLAEPPRYTFLYRMRDTEGGDTAGLGIYHAASETEASCDLYPQSDNDPFSLQKNAKVAV